MAVEKRASGFNKRAGIFMKSFLRALNGDTFTAVSSIKDENVSTEVPEKVTATLGLMEKMGHIELQKSPDGSLSAKLTTDGTAWVNHMFGGL